ncbi:MAG: YvcK family protein [Vallitaleaceae bacterium]|nr:YvcK family protein [Vallitaleaceae bacterium]
MKKEGHQIVCLGGGTGLSTMLRGLKEHTENLTAIVTVSDNGGGSGILRREMNMLPPGDIRNCLLALAGTEPLMNQIFGHRFTEGSLEGQNLGNLFLAALTNILGSFELAVEKANEVLAVKGKVIPVTTANVQLCALFDDGAQIEGETEIVERCKVGRKSIQKVYLSPILPEAYDKAIQALKEADTIVLGPGSLYTSIIPNLLVEGIAQTIRNSHAKVVYVSNIMTQPGETDHYTLKRHLDVIEEYLGKDVIDYIIVNDQEIDVEILYLYEKDSATQVIVDVVQDERLKVVRTSLAKINTEHGYIRHDPEQLAEVIINL